MATYKVLQDIEAEDKFIGPLTLKQFIFAGIASVSAWLSFIFLTHHLWFLALPLLLVVLAFGFLAWPWGRDQPTEIWLLAKVRFMIKPRLRIWDQTGIQELVTITAPKRDNVMFDELSQTEVRSRLKALAETIDSRGWATKDININMFDQPTYGSANSQQSDRLVSLSDFTRQVPSNDVGAADDILDEKNNLTAQHLDQMIGASTQAHKQAALNSVQKGLGHKTAGPSLSPPPSNWFMNASGQNPAYGQTKVIEPPTQAKKRPSVSHHRRSHSGHTNRDNTTSGKRPDPAILELAGNDDLTVATIARQAGKKPGQGPSDGEVVIPLR